MNGKIILITTVLALAAACCGRDYKSRPQAPASSHPAVVCTDRHARSVRSAQADGAPYPGPPEEIVVVEGASAFVGPS